MPGALVGRAIGEAGTREPLVRAMALLCGARVLAAAGKQAARQAFAEDAAIAEELPPEARIAGSCWRRRLPPVEHGFQRRATATMPAGPPPGGPARIPARSR
jgi:hypothetical protein